MASERQRLANQQNARKSTGPKTTEGKENSRRNALKHGLTGSGEVLNRSDARRLKKELKAWTAHLQPIDVLEDCLVRRAALASVRLRRCLKKDLADLARRKHRATKRWDVRQQKAVDECVELLETGPEEAVAQLEATSRGCDWLIEHWKGLAAALDEPGYWDEAQAKLAIRMCGKDPEAPMEDAAISKLRVAILAATPEPDPDEVDAFFEESTADLDSEARTQALNKRLPDRDTGRAMLRDVVEEELARLEPIREQLWEAQDAPARQQAEDVSLVDTSLAGARSLRYETAHEMSVHRSVNLLIRLRKVESEQQTCNRFSKMGIDQGRRFNGTNWEFVRDEAKAQEREAVEKRDYDTIAEKLSYKTGIPRADQAVQRSELEKVHEQLRLEAEAKAGTKPESGGPDGPAGAGVTVDSSAQDEANFSDANHLREAVYGASLAGSPTGNGWGSEPVNAVGSEVGRPVPAKTLFGEQTVPPGGRFGEQTGASGELIGEQAGSRGAVRNEAKSCEANGRPDVVYDDPDLGSRTSSGAITAVPSGRPDSGGRCVSSDSAAPVA